MIKYRSALRLLLAHELHDLLVGELAWKRWRVFYLGPVSLVYLMLLVILISVILLYVEYLLLLFLKNMYGALILFPRIIWLLKIGVLKQSFHLLLTVDRVAIVYLGLLKGSYGEIRCCIWAIANMIHGILYVKVFITLLLFGSNSHWLCLQSRFCRNTEDSGMEAALLHHFTLNAL